MALFKSKEEKKFDEIGKYLLESEVVEYEFGKIDKAFITNKRIIFKDISISLKSDVLEMVFIPFSKLDGVSYVEIAKLSWNRAVRIKSRGFSHDMGFTKKDESECIAFCNKLCEIMLTYDK